MSVNSKGNNEVSTCKTCRNYEKLLKEALDELNSVQTINRLLKNELLAYTGHTSTWGTELYPTEKDSDPAVCSAWSLVTTKTHTDKTKKCHTKTDKFIRTTNRCNPLIEVPTGEEGTIPVIVNGDISAKGSAMATNRCTFRQNSEGNVKANYRVTSQQEACGYGETNHKKSSEKNNVRTNTSIKLKNRPQQRKKHRIVIICDSHARGCASNMKHTLNDDFGITGFVKPGATIDTLITSIMEDSSSNRT
jgi:hypothetical protein